MQVYHWAEVEAFAEVFYLPPGKQSAADHAKMQALVQPAVDRFKALDEEDKRDAFRDKLGGYVRVYAFLSQIVPFADAEQEKLYSYGRLLLSHLPSGNDSAAVNLSNELKLQFYRMERIGSQSINLADGEADGVRSPTGVGSGKAKDTDAPLSEIIEALNERFATNFSDEDRLFFEQIKERALKNPKVIQTGKANPFDKFQLGIKALIAQMMIERMGENDSIVTRYMEDSQFEDTAFPLLAREIYRIIQSGDAPS